MEKSSLVIINIFPILMCFVQVWQVDLLVQSFQKSNHDANCEAFFRLAAFQNKNMLW